MNTPYDKGVVTSVRADDMLVITPLKWRLANGCIPQFFIKQSAPEHTPAATLTCEYKVGDVVYAPYGKGKITEIRKNDCLVITPTDWKLANGCVPTFYIKATPPQFTPGVSYDPLPPTIGYSSGYSATDTIAKATPTSISTSANTPPAPPDAPATTTTAAAAAAAAATATAGPYKVGDVVYAPYGKGKIKEIRGNGCLVITPTDWKLANNSVPTFYIQATPPQFTPGVSYDPLPPTIGYSSGYSASSSVTPPAPQSAVKLDTSTASEPEVWEQKAAKIAAAPEVPVVAGAVTINQGNTRKSQIMGETPTLDASAEKKKKNCIIS